MEQLSRAAFNETCNPRLNPPRWCYEAEARCSTERKRSVFKSNGESQLIRGALRWEHWSQEALSRIAAALGRGKSPYSKPLHSPSLQFIDNASDVEIRWSNTDCDRRHSNGGLTGSSNRYIAYATTNFHSTSRSFNFLDLRRLQCANTSTIV